MVTRTVKRCAYDGYDAVYVYGSVRGAAKPRTVTTTVAKTTKNTSISTSSFTSTSTSISASTSSSNSTATAPTKKWKRVSSRKKASWSETKHQKGEFGMNTDDRKTDSSEVGIKRRFYEEWEYDSLTEENMYSVASGVLVRFLRDVIKKGKVKKAIAEGTFAVGTPLYASRIDSSASIEEFGASFDLMMRPFSTIAVRAMRRFIRHSRILDNMKSIDTHASVFSSRILRSLDVSVHTSYYGNSAGSEDLIYTGKILECSFKKARMVVINGGGVTETHRLEICKHLKAFNDAVLQWQSWKSEDLVKRMTTVLHNLWGIETMLRTEVQQRAISCVNTPFIQAEADKIQRQSWDVEMQFMRLTCSFGGKKMMKKIKQSFDVSDTLRDPVSVTTRSRLFHSQKGVDGNSHNSKSHNGYYSEAINPMSRSKREMNIIVQQERCNTVVSVQAAHHEAVLDDGFYFKYPNKLRNDECLARMKDTIACDHAERTWTQLVVGVKGRPEYRNALRTIKQVRKQLEEMHLHTHKEEILRILDDELLQEAVNDESFDWRHVIRVFSTIAFAMRNCVGTEVSRGILYARRNGMDLKGKKGKNVDKKNAAKKKIDKLRAHQLPNPNGCCGKEEGHFVARPKAYSRLMSLVENDSRGGKCLNLHKLMGFASDMDRNESGSTETSDGVEDGNVYLTDDIKYALDETTYIRLKSMIRCISDADLTKSTSQLGVVFCETMDSITGELNKLDMYLNNTNLACTRMSTMTENVLKEQTLVFPWFQNGLGVVNTVHWLRHQILDMAPMQHTPGTHYTATTILPLVYRGYVSIIMAPDSQKTAEVDYPELMILDIEYIQKARGDFYGNVAQATVLVIMGQRLTELGVSAKCIHSCLGRISMAPSFILMGKAETCRGDECVVGPFLEMCSKSLQDVLPGDAKDVNNTRNILSQLEREISHNAYPSSPIASSIAKKWITATLGACEETTDGVIAVHRNFFSPEATRSAFSSQLLLPRAAQSVSRDFHFYVMGIFKRACFNFAVHSERYIEMMSIL